MRFELKPFDIDVIIIEPGLIATAFGDVVAGPALQRSVEGPYKQMAQAVASAGENANGRSYSPPPVIANTISRAIKAERPATRYVAGSMARPLMFVRKWFGDRAFDQLLARMAG